MSAQNPIDGDAGAPEGVFGEVRLEGQHDHTVDGKGRLSVPADFRLQLGIAEGDELVVTRHINEKCLLVYRPDGWNAFKARLEALPRRQANLLERVICGTARRVKLDRLGRIQLPLVLRRFAELDGKCFVMGQRHCMEIWATEVWDQTHGLDQYEEIDLGDFRF